MAAFRRRLAATLLAVSAAPAWAGPVGVEATHHGRDAYDGSPTTTFGLEASYRLKGPFSVLASAGPSFAGRGGDRYHAYAAVLIAFDWRRCNREAFAIRMLTPVL